MLDDGILGVERLFLILVVLLFPGAFGLFLRSGRSLFRLALLQELLGTGTGDGAQVVDHFLFRHAYAGIGNGDDMIFLVRGDADLQRQLGIAHLAAGGLKKAHLLKGVGSVGKKLTKEDLVIGVQRMGKNVEQLARFRGRRLSRS